MQIKLTVQEIHRKPDDVDADGVTRKKRYTLVVMPEGGKLEHRASDGAFLIHGVGQAAVDLLDIGAVITLKD
jgi:hypothetical protein